jgi:hypothetical protein
VSQVLGLFPQEFGFSSTEVTESTELLVDGGLQVELLDDHTRSEVEVSGDDFLKVVVSVSFSDGSVGVNVDGDRVSYTNTVSNLDECSLAESSSDETLGDPSGSISSRSVDLSGVLTGESTTSVTTPATISVNDDLSTSQTGITARSTDNERTRGVDVIDGVFIEVLGGDNGLDDVFLKGRSDFFLGDFRAVLSGDQDGVNSNGDDALAFSLVFNGDLGLGIGSQPLQSAVNSQVVESLADVEGQLVRKRHKFGGFVTSITNHEALITSTNVFFLLVNVDGVGDFRGLLFDGNKDSAVLVVSTLFNVVITSVLDGFSNNLFVAEFSVGGDFTEDHNNVGLDGSFTSNLGVRVLC